MLKCVISESKDFKKLESEDVNYFFDKKTGFMATWGKTKEEDPDFSPFGPFILDIEVTDICSGINNKPCAFCYKNNTPLNTKNMSFDTFKSILNKLKPVVTQLAIGADAQGTSNPDLFRMMDYARSVGIIPNLTLADVSEEVADKLSGLAGAVAVSRYADKNVCYDSVKRLTDRGMKQINIHQLISKETLEQAYQTIDDKLSDPRLNKLNAIVFLSLKQKGRGEHFSPVSQQEFTDLVKYAMNLGINFGMDSCSAHKFLEAIKDHPNYKNLEQAVEPCESSCFSSYVNCEGKYFPCSFAEKEGEGIDVLAHDNFMEVWDHPKTQEFRDKLIGCGRKCPLFNI